MKMLLFFCLLQPVLAEDFEIEIVSTPTHSLYYTLECLMATPRRSRELGQSFRIRVGNWQPVKMAIDAWKQSLGTEELSGLRFPRVQGGTPNLVSVLEKVSLESDGAADMARRVKPWLGPKHSKALHEVLTTMEPLYQAYWWGEAAPLMKRRMAEMTEHLERGDFSRSLGKVAAFYKGRLPEGSQPTLALVPFLRMPGQEEVRTHGHSSGSLQVMELVVERPLGDEAGVVFHEFVHALYAGQEPTETERWKERFFSHGLWGRLAYAQLNEGLATALGNGWFSQRVTGEFAEGSWYVDPVIDTYGKALLPVVRGAVEAGRAPTDRELDEMVSIFKVSLPEATSNFDVVAAQFLTVSNREEINRAVFQDELMRLGPVRSSRARSWGSESMTEATFRLYWLHSGEREKLLALGWSQEESDRWKSHRLKQSEQGWELAFDGEVDQLFDLLRSLQKNGLRQQAE